MFDKLGVGRTSADSDGGFTAECRINEVLDEPVSDK